MAGLGLRRRCEFTLDRALVGARWKRLLASHVGALAAESVMARLWRDYAVRLATLPRTGHAGTDLVQRWTMLSIALYRALLARGQRPDVARTLLRHLAWDGYRVLGAVAWMLAWRPGRERFVRTQEAMRHFRQLFLAPPAFAWRELPAQAGRAGFDCLHCPIAQRFAAEGLSDVAVHSICSLDRRLSASWGMRLVRTQTLADGGTLCDFRWYANDRVVHHGTTPRKAVARAADRAPGRQAAGSSACASSRGVDTR